MDAAMLEEDGEMKNKRVMYVKNVYKDVFYVFIYKALLTSHFVDRFFFIIYFSLVLLLLFGL